MAAVDHDRKLDRGRTPKVHEGIECGAHRAAREEHVINEDDVLAVHVKRNLGLVEHRGNAARHVIAVEADVELSHGRTDSLNVLDLGCKLLGYVNATTDDANERKIGGTLVVLDDLVGNAGEGSRHRRLVHNDRLGSKLFHTAPFGSACVRTTDGGAMKKRPLPDGSGTLKETSTLWARARWCI